jgi:signal transduction histidine kinase
VRTGHAEFYSEIPDWVLEGIAQDAEHLRLLRSTGLRSGMSVPLIARGKILGALTFVSAESGRRYTAQHLILATELAHRAALAIDNAGLYKNAQEALRSRDDFLAVVSHDMKNPLSAILLNVNQILKRISAESSRRMVYQLTAIQQAAERINRLISDLLDSAGLDTGQMVIEPQPESVTSLIHAALQIMQPIAIENAVRLEAHVEEQGLEVSCDRERILQVFSNLIGNAIKFAPESGVIRLSAGLNGGQASGPTSGTSSGGMVRFAVSDDGPGIPREQLEHIFERYWQGDRAIHRGVGLGLYIAKRLIEAHQGQLWCESVVHQGTTFYFTLPLLPSLM